ncbi:MAG: hypothetical protein ACK5CA_04190 [Cyanobacteriota bacterium]
MFDKAFFYFNKQAILLTNVDDQGKSFAERLKEGKKSLKLKPLELTNGERTLTELEITAPPVGFEGDLAAYFEREIKPFVSSLDYREQALVVTTEKAQYRFDPERETLIKTVAGQRQALGCGKIMVKSALKKGTKTKPEFIEITVELAPDTQKDYEIISYHPDPVENRAGIEAFMAKYITKPFEYLENVVGVEINFNKVFYQPERLRSVEEILMDIGELDQKLKDLERSLSL